MGLFDFFRKKPKEIKIAPSLDGMFPLYSQFGTNIYASDVVQQALKCIVDEISKLNPMHVRLRDNDPVPVKGSVQDVLNEPNELMTTKEFLEKITWLLLLNYNAFILPVYYTWIDKKTGEERRSYKALYPIKPTEINFIEDASGRLFVNFWFGDGDQTTIPYDDVIHIRLNYSVSEYMGGDLAGHPNNEAILQTLQLNDQLLRGIAKAMNSSYCINGILKYNTLLDKGKMAENIAEFERKLKSSESGILPLDLSADFTALPRNVQLVNQDTLKFVDEKILRNWGVPLSILTGDFTAEQFASFYQKTLEPIIKAMAQAFTKKMFTEREKAFGNRIELYPKDLIFMSMQQTLDMINTLAPTGGLYENEKRVALGLRPLPELEGKRFMSLNWIDANSANQYQVGKENIDIVDEEKTEV